LSYTNIPELKEDEGLALFNVKLHVLPAGHRFDMTTRQPIIENHTRKEIGTTRVRRIAKPKARAGSKKAAKQGARQNAKQSSRTNSKQSSKRSAKKRTDATAAGGD
jgi:hypothetical protein